jgi:ArsR family transcriptional regulator
MELDRTTAELYAHWFAALAEATRLRTLSLLACAGGPLTVGEIVAAVDVGCTLGFKPVGICRRIG